VDSIGAKQAHHLYCNCGASRLHLDNTDMRCRRHWLLFLTAGVQLGFCARYEEKFETHTLKRRKEASSRLFNFVLKGTLRQSSHNESSANRGYSFPLVLRCSRSFYVPENRVLFFFFVIDLHLESNWYAYRKSNRLQCGEMIIGCVYSVGNYNEGQWYGHSKLY